MSTYNYSINNFISTPTNTDVVFRIYNINNELKYTFDPKVCFFYTKNNLVGIKLEDQNDIFLDFQNKPEAVKALSKLNSIKKIFVEREILIESEISTPPTTGFSKSNLNMFCIKTTIDGDPALNTGITTNSIVDIPISTSYVRVYVNGVEVNVGGKTTPYECYFSHDNGVTARTLGTERQGDFLFWNGSVSGYQLDQNDQIDFIYLI
jgi:hypothetical protein